MILHRFSGMFVLVSFIASSTGCGQALKRPDAIYEAQQVAWQRQGEPYRLTPGDILDVRFYFTPELDQEVVVRPDGSVALPLVGDMMAARLTVDEARQELLRLYQGKLRDPDIAIIVKDFAGQRVFVGGEILEPGPLAIDGATTVLSAITEAGGFSDRARTNEVVLIRRRLEEGRPVIVPLNMKAVLEGTDMTQDLALLPYDIVYVPVSPIGNVNIWVDQYIRRIIPTPYVFTEGQ